MSRELKGLLGQDGHDVTHALDETRGQSDPRQFLNALDTAAVLVTLNVEDFILVQRAWRLWTARWATGQRHHGIVGLPSGQGWVPRTWRDELRWLLEHRQPFDNEMFVWNKAAGWHTVEWQ